MTLMPDAVDSTCWVVIPLYNEATMIGGVIDELRTRFAHVVCVDEEDTPCAGWVEEQLLAAPSGHWLAMLASKMLLQQPYPLVVGDEGPHRRLHCFGP